MKKALAVLKTLAVVVLVLAVMPNLADAAEKVQQVLVTNDTSAPLPTQPVGTTTVGGTVSIGNTPAVTVENNPLVSLHGSDNLVRSADKTEVVLQDTWEHNGDFFAYRIGGFVEDYETIRYLVQRQAVCSTDVEYEITASFAAGAGRSVTIDEGVIPAVGADNVRTGVFELPGRNVSVEIRAGTPDDPCIGGVVVVGRRN